MGPLTSTVPPRGGSTSGHLAYFILDLVEDLGLGDIERVLQAKDPRRTPYSPRMPFHTAPRGTTYFDAAVTKWTSNVDRGAGERGDLQ
jgi:hypothetical protein